MGFPSSFVDLQELVIGYERLDSIADRPRVKDWLNKVYARAVLETEALHASTTMPLTPNVATYAVPAVVGRVDEIIASPPGGGYGPPLEETSLAQILAWRQTGSAAPVTNATSTWYALSGMNDLDLFPTPANADTLTIYHFALPVPLNSDSDMPILQEPYATDVLSYGASFEAAVFKSSPSASDWHGLSEDSKRRLMQHLNRRRSGATRQLRVEGEAPVALRRDIA